MSTPIVKATLVGIVWSFHPCPDCIDGRRTSQVVGWRKEQPDRPHAVTFTCRTCNGFAQLRVMADYSPPKRSTGRGERRARS